MMKTSCIFILISVIVSLTSSDPVDQCSAFTNSDCKTCLKNTECAFCKNTKRCFLHQFYETNLPCSPSDMQYKTCVGSLQIWLIVLGSAGGVILIAVIIIIICCRRKCVRRARQKDQAKEDAYARNLEDRRTTAAVRSEERKQSGDNLRMKYGLLKAKDDGTDYKRFS